MTTEQATVQSGTQAGMAATAPTTAHLVVPVGIDDPLRPSGGNHYDRRVRRGLTDLGWTVREHAVPGAWPEPDGIAREALAAVLAGLPDGAVVVLDGLLTSAAPEELVRQAARLRPVVLVHLPLGVADDGARAGERRALVTAVAVVTTSAWTRRWLLEHYGLAPDRVHVVEPGVEPAGLAPGTTGGGRFLCVAAVTPVKGHDVLLEALVAVADRPWQCVCVGGLDRDPGFVAGLLERARAHGVEDRLSFPGPLAGADLERAYAEADALVLASRAETYGMVVTEALARGLPVIAAAAGGLPETLDGGIGPRPGLLVPPDDPAALADALREWFDDPGLRHDLRRAATLRRSLLGDWSGTAARFAEVLAEVGS